MWCSIPLPFVLLPCDDEKLRESGKSVQMLHFHVWSGGSSGEPFDHILNPESLLFGFGARGHLM
jgi:hypothetical protein